MIDLIGGVRADDIAVILEGGQKGWREKTDWYK